VPDNDNRRSKTMLMNPPQTLVSFRALWLASIAAIAALAMWLLLPGAGGPAWHGDGGASLPPSLKVDGAVTSTTIDGSVVHLEVPLAVRGDDPIRLTQGGRIHAMTYMAETASAAVPAIYTVAWLDGNGDEFLDPGEHTLLTVDLPKDSAVTAVNPAKLVIKPVDSTPLSIEDVLP
jgi:hypothetical protein